MDIKLTKAKMREMIIHSENLKRGFAGMVLIAPQILEEEDVRELRQMTDTLAANFESCASWAYSFGRITPNSKKFIPKINVEEK